MSGVVPLVEAGGRDGPTPFGSTGLEPGATAGAVVLDDGTTRRHPGLDEHPLLAPGGGVCRIARLALSAGQVYRSFLWPVDGSEVDGHHARITVLAARDVPTPVLGTVLLTPHGPCRGLTPRELEVLGLVVDGCSNQQVAHRLTITPRTVASHVEHILGKLGVPSRTLAAVQAERNGCYVPAAARWHQG